MKAIRPLIISTALIGLASCSTRHIAWQPSALDSAEQKKYTITKAIIGYQQYAEVMQDIPMESKTKVGFSINTQQNGYQVAHPDSGYSTIKILYGTDRALVKNSAGTLSYGFDTTAVAGQYTVGYTIVTVPNTHVVGKEETPGFFRIFNRKRKKKFIVQQSIVPMSDDKFNDYLQEHSSKYDAFIFVHGFNNSFEDAALRTAQLAADIKLPMAR
jgi:esterase/lipase superfamily enzyme